MDRINPVRFQPILDNRFDSSPYFLRRIRKRLYADSLLTHATNRVESTLSSLFGTGRPCAPRALRQVLDNALPKTTSARCGLL